MKINSTKLFKIIALFICFFMFFEQSGFAQVAGELDISGQLMAFRNSLVQDKFRPLHLRYLQYDSQLNNFKLLLDKGNLKTLSSSFVEKSAETLLQYFLIGIALPNNTFWVNLRPDAQDNIIDPLLAQTDVGKVLLETDVQLKKDTARFTSPETPEGKEYWDKLYHKAAEIYGSENVTIPTLTRPWIVPNEIIIREANNNAYIYKATLKVMLEEDYLKGSAAYSFNDERQKELNTYAAQVLREKIIPKLTQEVNTSQRYAALRQVYYSLILAQWFKQRFINQGTIYSNLIDRCNLSGLRSEVVWSKTTYFNQYQKSFKGGEYNFKVPVSTPQGQVIRSYFSGGVAFGGSTGIGALMLKIKAGTRDFFGAMRSRMPYLAGYEGTVSNSGEISGKIVDAQSLAPDELISAGVSQPAVVVNQPETLFNIVADLRNKPLDPRADIFNKVSNQEDREKVTINLSNLLSNEGLVSVADFELAWQRDPKDKKQTPFLLRRSVAVDLQELDKELRKIGLHLVIRDGFRTIREQRNNIKEAITNTIKSKVSGLTDEELLKISGFAFEQDMLLRKARPKALNNLVGEKNRQQATAPLLDPAINQFLADNNIRDPARISAIRQGIIETLADAYYRFSNPERTMPHLSGGAFDVEIRNLNTNRPIPTKAWVIFGNKKETEIPQEEKELYKLANTKAYKELEEYFLQYPTGPPQEYTQRQQEIYGQLKTLLENRRLYYWIFNLDSKHGGILNPAQTFVGLPGEHWHFGRGDRTSAIVADTPAYYDAVVTEEDAEFFSVAQSVGKIKEDIPLNEIEKIIDSNKLLVEDIVGLVGQDVYAVEFFDGTSSNAKNLSEIKTAIDAKRATLGIGDRIILFGRFIGLGRLEKAFQEKMQARDLIRQRRRLNKQDLKNEPIRNEELDKINGFVSRSPAFDARIAEDPLGSVRNIHRWNIYFKDKSGSRLVVNNVSFTDIERLAKAYGLLDANAAYNAEVDYLVPDYDQDKNAKDSRARIVFSDGTAVDNLKYDNIETVIKNKISPSGPKNQGKKGGIDFSNLPIVTQPMVPAGVGRILPRVMSVSNINLDKEWQQIENMLNAGIIPSIERLKGYIENSCKTNDCQERMNKVLSGVADMLRLEEERSTPTEVSLKQILNLLESNKSTNDLQLALTKIMVLAKEPILIGQ